MENLNTEKMSDIVKIKQHPLPNIFYTNATPEEFESLDDLSIRQIDKCIAIKLGLKKSRMTFKEFKFFIKNSTGASDDNGNPTHDPRIIECLSKLIHRELPHKYADDYYQKAFIKCKHLEKEADILMRNTFFESVIQSPHEKEFAAKANQVIGIAHLVKIADHDQLPIVSETMYTITVDLKQFLQAQKFRETTSELLGTLKNVLEDMNYEKDSENKKSKSFFGKIFGKKSK